MATIVEELSALVAQLPQREQERVLSFARALAHPPIFPHTPLPPAKPKDLLLSLRVPPEVTDAMEQAHEECEWVWPHTPLPPGSPPDALLRIRVDPEVGEAMERALEDCERIWLDG